MNDVMIQHYMPAIKKLPTNQHLTKSDLINKDFLIQSDDKVKMYYAPHNEYINTKAKIVIVGITPGFKQMKIAYEQLVSSLATNFSLEESLFHAKKAAGFAGPMRRNLIHMLNQCYIPQALHLNDATDLFGTKRDLLHTTSVIKYPIFVNDKNYTGYQPKIHRSDLLQSYAFTAFPKELKQISSPSLIIPLGKTVEQVLSKLPLHNKHYLLTGFPHPSGANGHRVKQFQEQKHHLQHIVTSWARHLLAD